LVNRNSVKNSALKTLKIEIENLQKLHQNMDESIIDCVEIILSNGGRVVISGIGKSAIIAQKIVSTLNSTGTPALFMHAADAVHGDLGMIQKSDVVIILSNSGNTAEIKTLVPLIKSFGNVLVAFTGNNESFLANNADIIISCKIEKEACPLNLAPTSSTTAQMVMGDALAVALIECRNFKSEDFSKFHPGGALGKKLYTTVGDICAKNQLPKVNLESSFSEIVNEISSKRLGATAVLVENKVFGIITDGDIRRAFQKTTQVNTLNASEMMNPIPKTIEKDALATESLQLFTIHNISQLIVLDNTGDYFGMLHLHDLSREEII